MKKPATPLKKPKLDIALDIWERLIKAGIQIQATQKGEYLHWDELRNKQPRPAKLSAEEWWAVVKILRQSLVFTALPFVDTQKQPFKFIIPNAMLPKLANIDRKSGGPVPDFKAYNQDAYLVRSLVEEAISSSQLEGASTTRRVAKEMLLSNRKPRTDDEQMIFNNYRAMQFIREHKHQKLSVKFILEIHHILTEHTLEDAGQLRTNNDIHVTDERGDILHTPPKAKELKKRLEMLCQFANADETEENHYIHPVIKAIILHFSLAYDHPFSDGNGRTARALFYWFMLNRGYWLMEFISISEIIKKSPTQYGTAFLYTETDENDVTYFIFHQLKVILKAIDELYRYINEQTQELQKVEKLLHHNQVFNHRQLTLIHHALKNPHTRYTIGHHRQSHNITYETARTDLLKMAKLGVLTHKKIGKAFVFIAPIDLKQRIEKLKTK